MKSPTAFHHIMAYFLTCAEELSLMNELRYGDGKFTRSDLWDFMKELPEGDFFEKTGMSKQKDMGRKVQRVTRDLTRKGCLEKQYKFNNLVSRIAHRHKIRTMDLAGKNYTVFYNFKSSDTLKSYNGKLKKIMSNN